ncbi:hypothetical protein C8T65DRAFT_740624 [Cerioporus squamosus]|nr:hypothetical protein C8T65DRAFT_740624 [Cerioporus squamosus]
MSSPPPHRVLASFRKQAPEAEHPWRVRISHPFRNEVFLSIPVRRCPLPGDVSSANACIPLTALLDACHIVTGVKGGVLALDDFGQQLVHSDLVDKGLYHYIVHDDPKEDYPIFHSLDEWVPPIRQDVPDCWFTSIYPRVRSTRGNDPRSWDAVSGETANTLRSKAREYDGACRLSGFDMAVDACHIVPTSLSYWFSVGRDIVSQLHNPYPLSENLDENLIDDIRNLLTLRKDIHDRWEDHAFAFIPVDGRFVAYYMSLADP